MLFEISCHLGFHVIWDFLSFEISCHLRFHVIWHFMSYGYIKELLQNLTFRRFQTHFLAESVQSPREQNVVSVFVSVVKSSLPICESSHWTGLVNLEPHWKRTASPALGWSPVFSTTANLCLLSLFQHSETMEQWCREPCLPYGRGQTNERLNKTLGLRGPLSSMKPKVGGI